MTASRDRGGVELAVVVPVFRCCGGLLELHRRLTDALGGLEGGYEVILVEDGAGDGSWSVVRELAASDPYVRGLRLARNYGQSVAILAGLDHCDASWVAVMDCDLQDSPESLRELLATAQQGHDAVAARRPTGLLGHAAFALLNALSTTHHDPCAGGYRVLGPRVVEELRRSRLSGGVFSLSVNEVAEVALVDVPRGKRSSGRSSYSLPRLVGLWLRSLAVHGRLPGRRLLHSNYVVDERAG